MSKAVLPRANRWAELTNLTSGSLGHWPKALIESVRLAVPHITECIDEYCPDGHSKQLDHKHRKQRAQKY
jgi:hypothetical protein